MVQFIYSTNLSVDNHYEWLFAKIHSRQFGEGLIETKFNFGNRRAGFFRAYKGNFSERFKSEISRRPEILAIELNVNGRTASGETQAEKITIQADGTWALERLKAALPANLRAGANTDIYVADSGLKTDHQEFAPGRASVPLGFISVTSASEGGLDNSGHGTHVASLAGGATCGLARDSNVISLKVCNQQNICRTDDVVQALQYVYFNKKVGRRSIINLSLVLPRTVFLEHALNIMHNDNIPVLVAAGNLGVDGCQNTLASIPTVIAIGSYSNDIKKSPFSNFGACVSIYAPGDAIKGAAISPAAPYTVLAGTSMATAFVSGFVSLFLESSPFANVDAVKNFLLAQQVLKTA